MAALHPYESLSTGNLFTDKYTVDKNLGPLLADISARSADFERQRHISNDIISRFKQIGVYRALVPKIYGGDECSPAEFCQLIEQWFVPLISADIPRFLSRLVILTIARWHYNWSPAKTTTVSWWLPRLIYLPDCIADGDSASLPSLLPHRFTQ